MSNGKTKNILSSSSETLVFLTGIVGDQVHLHALISHEIEQPQGSFPLQSIAQCGDCNAIGYLGGLDALGLHLVKELQCLFPLLSLGAGW